MTQKKFLEPKDKLVDIFSGYWSKKPTQIQLFSNDEKITVSEFENINKALDDIKGYKIKDGEILDAKKFELSDFLEKINSTYHTRVSNIDGKDGIVENLNNKKKIKNVEMLEAAIKTGSLSLNDFVCDICKERTGGQYSYSFATKVYSFLDEKKYPIIDSYVASLLAKYDEEYQISSAVKEDKINKSTWGDYSKYKKFYDKFIETFDLNKNYKYKKIDQFLWTYATLMNAYWLDMGAFIFSSVSFDPKSK